MSEIHPDLRVGCDPAIISSAPVLRFHGYWLSRCRDGRLPAKADIDPVDIPALLPNVILTRVVREAPGVLDFEYRLIGDAIVRRMGNLVGRRVRAAAPLHNVNPSISSAYRNYCAVVESAVPQFLEGHAVLAHGDGRPRLMSRVHCPLSSDGAQVDFIISCVTLA